MIRCTGKQNNHTPDALVNVHKGTERKQLGRSPQTNADYYRPIKTFLSWPQLADTSSAIIENKTSMIITNITRTYSKSINTKNYGIPESWIKIEAQYAAQVESSDDPVKVSEMLYDQARKDVIASTNNIIAQIEASKVAPAAPTAPNTTAVPTTPAPRQL